MNTKEQFKIFKKAIKENNQDNFLNLIKQVDLNNPINEEGDYPLIYAIKYKASKFNQLFNVGADINVSDENGMTALMHLTQIKQYHSSEVREYLKKAKNLNQIDNEGNTLLMHLAKNSDIRMLNELKNKIPHLDLNIQNHEGDNAIMIILKQNQRPNHQIILKYLIDQGSKTDLINKDNESLYLLAIKSNSETKIELVEKASSNIDLTLRDTHGLCAFDYAINMEDLSLMKRTYYPDISLEYAKNQLPFIENSKITDWLNTLFEKERLELSIETKETKNKIKI